jgi:capsule polysaccharide export protein KpsE/RkpR
MLSRVRFLWESRGLLLRVFLISIIVSTLLAFLIPNRYEAFERLMPPDGQSANMGAAMLTALMGRASGGSGGGGGLGAFAGDLIGMKNSGALFVGILQSRTVQDRLIEEFDLKKVYRQKKIEDTRAALDKHTDLSEDRKSGIITIKVTDHDPKLAASLARAYVGELDRLVAEVSTSSARRERVFLEGRLVSVKKELDTAAHQFSDFASKNTAIDVPAQGKAMVEAAAVLQGQLIAAESELSGLEAIYTDQNVRVRALRARIAELRSQLGKMGGDANAPMPSPGKNDPAAYPTIRQLPVLGVTYANLYRQTKIEETVYELLTQQYELAKVQEAKELPSVKVLDAAVVPTKKSFPPRLVFIALGAVLGVAGAALWLFAKRYWAAIDPQDPGKILAQDVLENLREDSRRLAPAFASFSRTILRKKTGQDSESAPEERKPDAEGISGKRFTRAAGQSTD